MMDYVTYVWASQTRQQDMQDGSDMYEVEFNLYYLRTLIGHYRLGYFSHVKNCIIGYSDVFRVSVKLRHGPLPNPKLSNLKHVKDTRVAKVINRLKVISRLRLDIFKKVVPMAGVLTCTSGKFDCGNFIPGFKTANAHKLLNSLSY